MVSHDAINALSSTIFGPNDNAEFVLPIPSRRDFVLLSTEKLKIFNGQRTEQLPLPDKVGDLTNKYLVLILCCRYQVPELVLLRNPRNLMNIFILAMLAKRRFSHYSTKRSQPRREN